MDSYLGQIMQVGFSYAPPNWSTCQGQSIGVRQNTALFALLGVTFGGDGVNNFQLPNTQSRVMVGAGQGQGLSAYTPGQMGGNEQVTLNSSQMPAHVHGLSVTAGLQAVSNNGTGTASATPAEGSLLGVANDDDTGAAVTVYVPAGTSGVTTVNLGGLQVSGTTSSAGGNQPFPVLSPYLAITTLICTAGIYPSRQ